MICARSCEGLNLSLSRLTKSSLIVKNFDTSHKNSLKLKQLVIKDLKYKADINLSASIVRVLYLALQLVMYPLGANWNRCLKATGIQATCEHVLTDMVAQI